MLNANIECAWNVNNAGGHPAHISLVYLTGSLVAFRAVTCHIAFLETLSRCCQCVWHLWVEAGVCTSSGALEAVWLPCIITYGAWGAIWSVIVECGSGIWSRVFVT